MHHALRSYYYSQRGRGYSPEALAWEQTVQATDSGNGTLTFNNAALPNGASATKRLGGVGSYVQYTVPSVLANSHAVVLTLSVADDANYTWNPTGSGRFLIGVFYNTTANTYYYAENNDSTGVSLSVAPVAGDVIRMERTSLNAIAIKRSTDGGETFATLVTRSTILANQDYPYIKCLNAVQNTGKQLLSGVGYMLKSKTLDISSLEVPLFIFTGESNSGGRALNSSATAGELAARTSVKIINNTSLAFEDLDIGTNNLIDHAGLAAQAGTEHSWELQLAKRSDLGHLGDAPVYLVKTGQGGTKIADWYVGATTYLSTDCWQKFQDRVDAALTLIAAAEPGKTITPYIFFTIGINDAIAATNTATFKTDVIAHIAKMRARYGASIPVVMTKIPAAYAAYNTVIDEIADADANTYAITTSDAALLGDGNHWDYSGQKLICDRMLDTSIGLQS